jgi:2-polyprenyl-6-methoxyphenol hydroxylase-like FAD-dependent oxidoreductase
MTAQETDVVIVGAGPVGLMCAYLGQLCGIRTVVLDKSAEPLRVGRADALNARTLQFLEIADLFKHLYPLGKPCNTSSVWANGKFVSRQSTWWDQLEGCFHKHFLMLGQSFVEQLLDAKLREVGTPVRRCAQVLNVQLTEGGCLTTLLNGETIRSRFVIGADGSRSLVRDLFKVPFEVTRPQILWAVLDGVVDTDFPKVPEIIVFQADTSDVAWIPREGNIDRFYVRMDTKEFTLEQAIAKINRALQPHTLRFREMVWFSQFSVKESVAERFSIDDRVFLTGDACHIHSVNGGMGLNTGLGDAFNLMWKLHMVMKFGAPTELLCTYEEERKPVAMSVVETSGELVRSTKYSKEGTHAEDYVDIVQRRAGNVTGMGIRYGGLGICGARVYDFEVHEGHKKTRLYSLLDYARFTLLVFGEGEADLNLNLNLNLNLPAFVKVIRIHPKRGCVGFSAENCPYADQVLLVRPDSYIAASSPLDKVPPSFVLAAMERGKGP